MWLLLNSDQCAHSDMKPTQCDRWHQIDRKECISERGWTFWFDWFFQHLQQICMQQHRSRYFVLTLVLLFYLLSTCILWNKRISSMTFGYVPSHGSGSLLHILTGAKYIQLSRYVFLSCCKWTYNIWQYLSSWVELSINLQSFLRGSSAAVPLGNLRRFVRWILSSIMQRSKALFGYLGHYWHLCNEKMIIIHIINIFLVTILKVNDPVQCDTLQYFIHLFEFSFHFCFNFCHRNF